MKYQLNTLLAILQQAEYNLPLWRNWLTASRSDDQITRLNSLQPERWTGKLKLIKNLTSIISLVLSQTKAVELSVYLLRPFESLLTWVLMRLAANKLRRCQKRGLAVVGIAGSYGKTSVKHISKHILSHQWSVLMSPASYNTPLSLAVTILRQLDQSHQIFMAELGEYKTNDIADFLKWIQPDYAILTPVGFAHGERFGSAEKLNQTFLPLFNSKFKPKNVMSDESNRELVNVFLASKANQTSQVIFYGQTEASDYSLKVTSADFAGTSGQLKTSKLASQAISTRLIGDYQLQNALPGIALTELLGGNSQTAALSLPYAPDVTRRLSVIKNPNGSVVIDNSYNTNPGSWQSVCNFISQVKPTNLAIITAGFVELDPDINTSAHVQMANDLLAIASQIGIIESRYNQDLIATVKKGSVPFVIGTSQAEVINKLSQLENKAPKQTANSSSDSTHYLWLEGGLRELYQ